MPDLRHMRGTELGGLGYLGWWCCAGHLAEVFTNHNRNPCKNHPNPPTRICTRLQDFFSKSQGRQVTPRSELDSQSDGDDSDAGDWAEKTYDTYVQVTNREIGCLKGFMPEPTTKSYFGREDDGGFVLVDESTWEARGQKEGFKAGGNAQCCACTMGPCTYYGRTLVLDVEVYWPESD